MKHKKLLIIILVLAVVAVLVSAAMKKTSIFFNGDKTELKIESPHRTCFSSHFPSVQMAYEPNIITAPGFTTVTPSISSMRAMCV